jgi:branched-subunit amino acid transport protein AzlD
MHFTGLPVTIAVIALTPFATKALQFLFFSSREPPEMLPVVEENLPL